MRLIDADVPKKTLVNWLNWYSGSEAVKGVAREAVEIIDNAPTIDAEPVRHGRWVFEFALDDSNFYRCSECNRQEVLLAKESINEWCPYCHCGAKMDGKSKPDETRKICPVNGLDCIECVPGYGCAKMDGGAEDGN